jgi:hypothetical protein
MKHLLAILALACSSTEVEPTTWLEGGTIFADGGEGQCVVMAEFNSLESALEIRPSVQVNGVNAGHSVAVAVGNPARVYVMLSDPLRETDSVKVTLTQSEVELVPSRVALLCE